jgi:hypothetical protein
MHGNGATVTRLSDPLASAPERLEILEAGGRDVIGLWHNVLVVAYRTVPTTDQLLSLQTIRRELTRRFEETGYVTLAFLPPMSRPLPGDVLEMGQSLTSSTPPALRAVAMVIDGKGFLAATTRSLATGIVMVARPRWPMRIFPGVEPAAAWLSAWVDRGLRPTAPRRMAEAIRHTLV